MLMQLADRKEIVYEVSTNFALASMDDEAHPDLYVFLEDDEAVSLFWEMWLSLLVSHPRASDSQNQPLRQ